MAITNKQMQELSGKFDDIFTNQTHEIADILRVENDAEYEKVVGEVLEEEGFPTSADASSVQANHYNVDHELEIKPGKSPEDWAEKMVNDMPIESTEDFDKVMNNEDEFINFILDNFDDAETSVVLKETLEEWMEQNPSDAYFSQRLEEMFDSHELDETIQQDHNEAVQDKLKEALLDEGFPENTDPSELDYIISDSRMIKSFDDFAVEHVDEAIENYNTVKDYIDIQFYTDIVSNDDNYDFDIEITSDPEDFE